MSHLFYPHTRFVLENNPFLERRVVGGDSTPELAYPHIFCIVVHKEAMVVEVLSQGLNGLDWNLPFSRDPHE